MQCSHCGKCCEETEMELSGSDIERLEACGYRREDFAVTDTKGETRLKNVDKWCFFYDAVNKKCRVYLDRPMGCYLYPVVYSYTRGVLIDSLCPQGSTISDEELKIKGTILQHLLMTIDDENTEF